jgi:hypothetical protein
MRQEPTLVLVLLVTLQPLLQATLLLLLLLLLLLVQVQVQVLLLLLPLVVLLLLVQAMLVQEVLQRRGPFRTRRRMRS